ncbi:MAG: hypothetical protein WCR48_01605 [Bacteroidales bacterium]
MKSNIILYTTDSGDVNIQVQYEDGTFWLTQKRMAELFGVEIHTINYHLKEIFKTGELDENSVIRKIRITAISATPKESFRCCTTKQSHQKHWEF